MDSTRPLFTRRYRSRLNSVGDRETSVAAAGHPVGVVVELEVAGLQDGAFVAGLTGPAQHGGRAGDELLEAERLLQVVVTAHRQAAHLVLRGVPGGEEQHGRVVAAGAHAPAHLEAVEVGQHDVEHDEVGDCSSTAASASRPVDADDTSNP